MGGRGWGRSLSISICPCPPPALPSHSPGSRACSPLCAACDLSLLLLLSLLLTFTPDPEALLSSPFPPSPVLSSMVLLLGEGSW